MSTQWLRDNAHVLGGPGDLTSLLHNDITYHMGKCAEMRDHLSWLRAYNETHDRQVRFYGMDVPDSAASARPAVEFCLEFLADADPAYAASVTLDFDYLPADRTGLAWAAPALQAYLALDAATRNEMTARINELTERLGAQRVVVAAANGHVQRWPFSAPFMTNDLTMLGEHLAATRLSTRPASTPSSRRPASRTTCSTYVRRPVTTSPR